MISTVNGVCGLIYPLLHGHFVATGASVLTTKSILFLQMEKCCKIKPYSLQQTASYTSYLEKIKANNTNVSVHQIKIQLHSSCSKWILIGDVAILRMVKGK